MSWLIPGDFIDWATAVVGEGDTCQHSVSFIHHSSGPIYGIRRYRINDAEFDKKIRLFFFFIFFQCFFAILLAKMLLLGK